MTYSSHWREIPYILLTTILISVSKLSELFPTACLFPFWTKKYLRENLTKGADKIGLISDHDWNMCMRWIKEYKISFSDSRDEVWLLWMH